MYNKNNHLAIICFYFILSLWAVLSLSGCNQTSKNIPPANALISGNVTLIWNEIPEAASYNVYMSQLPGVTKRNGYKIPNVTNPFKINQLEPGKIYYFVVTAVNGSEESKESKELSYTAVPDKIGLIYWKNLFDKSIQDPKPKIAETKKEIKAPPEKTSPVTERQPLENEALSEKVSVDEKSSNDLAEERVAQPVNIEEDLTENSRLALEKMRLRAAQMLLDSPFHIFFEQNSNELSPKSIEKLDRIYEILANNPAARLRLNGYSDKSGSSSYKQMVSEIRANSVKSYLSGKGIKHSRMVASGHGAHKFIASNKSAEGRRLNRRVEIELIIP
jgi:outer membrane protein OmpA-like peptidoglycan-associated protein